MSTTTFPTSCSALLCPSRFGRWQRRQPTVIHDAHAGGAGARRAQCGAIVDGESLPGAGSVPGLSIPTPVLRFEGRAEHTWRRLADHDPPVIAARGDGATVVNLRSVDANDDVIVADALATI